MRKQIFTILESLGYFALFLLCQGIVVISITENEVTGALISNLLFIIVLLILFYIKQINFKERLEFNKIGFKNSVIVVALALLVNFGFQGIQLLFPEGMREGLIIEANGRLSGSLFISFISIAIFAPIAEEILFRGLIFGTLKKNINVYVAAVIQALGFGIMHGNIIWIVVATCTALFYAFLMEKYKSVLAPLLGHCAVNLLAFLIR